LSYLLFPRVFGKFIIIEDNQENMISDRVRRSMLSSDYGCNLLKNGGGEEFNPKFIKYSG